MRHFLANDYEKVQAPKVSLLKEASKEILSVVFRLIPISFIKPHVHFLYGHEVYLDQFNNFKKIIKKLKQDFVFVSYSKAVSLLDEEKLDNRYLCLSFDDGFYNNYDAAKFLSDEGLSAMFFVNPEVISHAGNKAYKAKHCQEKLNCKPMDFMNEDEVRELITMGHEVGNHGMSHQRLSTCNTKMLDYEIVKSIDRLKKITEQTDFHYAWCYGTAKDIQGEAMNLINKTHLSNASAIRGNTKSTKHFIKRNQIIFSHPYRRFLFFYKKAAFFS